MGLEFLFMFSQENENMSDRITSHNVKYHYHLTTKFLHDNSLSISSCHQWCTPHFKNAFGLLSAPKEYMQVGIWDTWYFKVG